MRASILLLSAAILRPVILLAGFQVRRRLLLPLMTACLLLLTGGVHARALPYDASADAQAQVDAAVQAAAQAGKPVLLLFGANWCGDCRALDTALHSARVAELLAQSAEVVKVDVGNFDHNMELAMAFGNPIAGGIPAAVLVGADRRVLYATRPGALADARRMSESGVYEFFDQMLAAVRPVGRP